MEFQQIISLFAFVTVFALLATRWVHRVALVVASVVLLAFCLGPKAILGSILPEVLLTLAGWMVLAGFVKRSGLASWFALKAAKISGGRPAPILLLLGLFTYALGALLGPQAAVVLVVPVALLLAVELDVAVLPFLVVLSWTSLLGSATVQSAQAGNLWMGKVLGIDGGTWVVTMLPLTAIGLAITLALGLILFRKQLRVTNERRARVLEYDEARSLGEGALVFKTVGVLLLVVVGLIAGPFFAVSASTVVVGGAVLLAFLDHRWSLDRPLADLDGGTLLFYGSLFPIVAAIGTITIPPIVVSVLDSSPLALLWLGAVGGALVDQGAVQGAFLPLLQSMQTLGHSTSWAWVTLGITLGAGASVWGSASTATALGLAGQAGRGPSWRDFVAKGVLFSLLNLVAFSFIGWLLVQ